MDAETFVDELTRRNTRLFTGVPCSFFQAVYTFFRVKHPELYIPAANEGVAQAIACGAALAGMKSAVLIQNSGLGNLVNPLTSLNAPYRIPSLLFVSGRGVGIPDEPQHVLMGSITQTLLEQCGAKVWAMRDDPASFGKQLDEAEKAMAEGESCAFIVPKGTIDAFKADPDLPERPMSRARVLELTCEVAPPDSALVATTGKTARELFAIGDDPRNFYSMGSMGHAAGLALGICRARPDRRVVVLDGDGAALMHLGTLSTIGACAPARLTHVVIDNETYESTGNQLTTSPTTDFTTVARACGYAAAIRADTEAEFRSALTRALESGGPTLIHVKVRLEGIPDVPRITTRHSAPEIASNFSQFLAFGSDDGGSE